MNILGWVGQGHSLKNFTYLMLLVDDSREKLSSEQLTRGLFYRKVHWDLNEKEMRNIVFLHAGNRILLQSL